MAVVKPNPLLMKLPKLAAFLKSVERNSIGSKNAYFSGLRHLPKFTLEKSTQKQE